MNGDIRVPTTVLDDFASRIVSDTCAGAVEKIGFRILSSPTPDRGRHSLSGEGRAVLANGSAMSPTGMSKNGGLGLSALDSDAAAAIAVSKDTDFRGRDVDLLRGVTGVFRPSGT